MSEEKVYPYIGKGAEDGVTLLMLSQSKGAALNDVSQEFGGGEWRNGWNESYINNITHEYLANTWGIVESKEHAEFIIELAKVNGFTSLCAFNGLNKYFNFYEDNLYFWVGEDTSKCRNEKQITIPPPPAPSSSASKVNRDIERAVKVKINDGLSDSEVKKEKQIVDGNKYHREIIGLDGTKTTVDVYRVLDAFKTSCHAADHAIKKMLCAGLRGYKDKVTDYDNAIESMQAARLLLLQKGGKS